MALLEGAQPGLGAGLRRFEETPCKHCGQPLGAEAVHGVMYPAPIGLVGFVHSTVCLDAYDQECWDEFVRYVEVA